MGQTMAEKILARHSGRESVQPGEYVWADIDGTGVLGMNIPRLAPRMEELGIERVFDTERVYCVEDHFAPAPSVAVANNVVTLRKWVKKYNISNYFEWGRHGIIHELFSQRGYCSPGDLIASVDSHSTSYGCFNVASCAINEEQVYVLATGQLWFRVPPTIRFDIEGTLPGAEGFVVGKDVILRIAGEYGTEVALYKAAEFHGPAVNDMSVASRFSIANMGVEIGAKFAIFPCDEKTLEYLDGKMKRPPNAAAPDPDCTYEARYSLDVTGMSPYVALPHDPSTSVPVTEVETQRVRIDQAFLGSCNSARMEDFRMAARILKGKQVAPWVRFIVTPASQDIWRQCAAEGIWDIFAEAGAVVTNSTCGACPGFHMGVLGDGEVCISSMPRNFQGRMGSPEAQIYLANSATVTASAVTGHVTDPRQFLEG